MTMTSPATEKPARKLRLMRTPKSVDIDITDRCNLRCQYCYFYTSPADIKQDLPRDEWLRFFEELNGCAVTEVCLAGGEPFIREDLPDIIRGIVRNRMRFSILSNGTLITDDLAAFLASTGRCNFVQVSSTVRYRSPTTPSGVRGVSTRPCRGSGPCRETESAPRCG